MRQRVFSFLVLMPSFILFGAMAGGLVAGRWMERPADGWSQIAQALGGVMLGALAGFALALPLALRGAPRTHAKIALGALLGALGLFGLAYLTRPYKERASSPPPSGQSVPKASTRPVAAATEAPQPPPAPALPAAPTRSVEPAISADSSSPAVAVAGDPSDLTLGRLPCEGGAERAASRFNGLLQAGQTFRGDLGPSWELVLEPFTGPRGAAGWTIRVLEPASRGLDVPSRDLARFTPPLRGPSPRRLEAWHFLDAEGRGLNEGEVNAPQWMRLFVFSPEVGRTLGVDGTPTPEEIERLSSFGRGALEVVDFELSPPTDPGRPETAGFRSVRFEACISWPRDGSSVAGGVSERQAVALRACGLDESYRLWARLDPPIQEADFDGDGIADLAALVRRDQDPAPALAVCRRGSDELSLIGPHESLEELSPAYFESIDRWRISGGPIGRGAGGDPPPRLLGAGLSLAKEDSSSALVYWNGDRWASYWPGD